MVFLDQDIVIALNLIEVYELIGRRDKALEAVRKLFEMGGSLELIEKNPDLKALCQDPRYAEFTHKKGGEK